VAVEQAIADVLTRDLALIERVWGDPVTLLAGCLRGLFTAKPGHDLVCVDFSAIEAVVAACVSRCQWRIEVFGGHGKIYEESAARATGIPFDEILQHKIDTGQHHKARGTIGKVRELAGGYGGWVGAWKAFGADAFMTDIEIKLDVLRWRAESPEIVYAWGGQFVWCGPGKWNYRAELHGMEGAAIQAIMFPGQTFEFIDVAYAVHNDVLYCRLPSGRYLHYHSPRLSPVEDKLRRGPAVQITFEGYNSNAMKGPVGWHRLETYGGRLFENVVQAIAADIQADALKRCEAAGYPIVSHTHDEMTAEMPEGTGSIDEMSDILTARPEWGKWWPIRAAGWRGKRYRKD
jgi:DNA polymerase